MRIEEQLCDGQAPDTLECDLENSVFIERLIPVKTAPFCWEVIIFIQTNDSLTGCMESNTPESKKILKNICCKIYREYLKKHDHKNIAPADQVTLADAVLIYLSDEIKRYDQNIYDALFG
jgi:hypothetical protein